MSDRAKLRGRFITFEGGEGVGKSTQIRLLEARLRAAGLEVVVTREPGGSQRAETIREYILGGGARALGPMAEALLFSAARIDHIDALIRPALQAGKWVLCDRFADSTRAYQGANGKLDDAVMQALEQVTLAGVRPDLTLVLDMPPAIGLQRAAARREAGAQPDRFESEGLGFHARLRKAFHQIANAEPGRCAIVNADRAVPEVEAAIFAIVDERLGEAVTPLPAITR